MNKVRLSKENRRIVASALKIGLSPSKGDKQSEVSVYREFV